MKICIYKARYNIPKRNEINKLKFRASIPYANKYIIKYSSALEQKLNKPIIDSL